jgi:hypothetical protein
LEAWWLRGCEIYSLLFTDGVLSLVDDHWCQHTDNASDQFKTVFNNFSRQNMTGFVIPITALACRTKRDLDKTGAIKALAALVAFGQIRADRT